MRDQSPRQANPVRLLPAEPGWLLAIAGLLVVVAAIGGVSL